MKRSGASLALSAVLAFGAAGEAKAGSWDEKVFASHVDFDAVAAEIIEQRSEQRLGLRMLVDGAI